MPVYDGIIIVLSLYAWARCGKGKSRDLRKMRAEYRLPSYVLIEERVSESAANMVCPFHRLKPLAIKPALVWIGENREMRGKDT